MNTKKEWKQFMVFLAFAILIATIATLLAPRGNLRAQAKQHNITLTWLAGVPNPALGETPDVSFNVYRSTTTGGPYTQIAAGVTVTTFVDTHGIGGTKYFYVVTGTDSGGFESGFSNEANATFLGNPATPSGNTTTAH